MLRTAWITITDDGIASFNMPEVKCGKIVKYPDGQQDILLDYNFFKEVEYNTVHITTRLRNWFDLERLVALVSAIRGTSIQREITINVAITYFCGARSDRRFQNGGNFYLRDVICPVINSLNLNSVGILDPHSDVVLNTVNRAYGVEHLQTKVIQTLNIPDLNIICPDIGAFKRMDGKYKLPIIQATKHRDVNGKITGTAILADCKDKDALIIDDLCDGGRTFIEISKKFKEMGGNAIFLAVTHGIFSAGLDVLRPHFNGIFCTNSYSDIDDTFVTQENVI